MPNGSWASMAGLEANFTGAITVDPLYAPND
ncbi:opacity protein-like surface antigen [Aureimonas pseudogalii]|uniref:Opacity protein-like surface antigen n=1 Tax=Aureimonas pseudogalii TaxID=1744844 RepID=A0A7W6H9J1_9HYPH|nr:opacity protein-like surface antigen [Aureimonas pseudogalii]